MSRTKPPHSLAARLLAWYDAGHRDLPWRRNQDPYRIWLSEVMLQQTRAEAAIPYFERFLNRFPNLESLAAAPEDDVLALWSGLGYYSRARNLHKAARAMSGVFPSAYGEIRALPGVGDYTAAAIASIAFGLPHAVLDGNVMRVVARLTNDSADIGSGKTRARFREIAQQWLDPRRSGAFNQAIMELGATVCLPRTPRCGVCPLVSSCAARRSGAEQQLPVKLGKKTPIRLEMDVVVAMRGGRLLLAKRPADACRLAGFWELPSPAQLPDVRSAREAGTFRHTITHHHYVVTVLEAAVKKKPAGLSWIPLAALPTLPLSTTVKKALKVAMPAR